MIALIFMGPAFIVGVVSGRWWTLALSLPVGVWTGATSDVEVGGLIIGAGYGLLTALGGVLGVVVRRQWDRSARPTST